MMYDVIKCNDNYDAFICITTELTFIDGFDNTMLLMSQITFPINQIIRNKLISNTGAFCNTRIDNCSKR